VVNVGNLRLDQPRSTGPRLSCNCLFDERPQNLLCEDLAISRDVRIIYNGFFGGAIVKADEIPREGCADRAIRQNL